MKAFHSFRLDASNHCLWRGEERVSLAPKAFDVLRYLVEHADRLVTQEEILETLWPSTYVNPEVVRRAENPEKCQRCWRAFFSVGHYNCGGNCTRRHRRHLRKPSQ